VERWAVNRATSMGMTAAGMATHHAAPCPAVTVCSRLKKATAVSSSDRILTASHFAPGQVVLKAVPDVPIYYTTNNASALENTAYLADKAVIYDAAKGIPIPAG
jgi:hypothetical protein